MLAGDILATNLLNPNDVNNDRLVSASDALAVINQLGQGLVGESEFVDPRSLDAPEMFYDVNADNRVSASDALAVVNALSQPEAVGELVSLYLNARDQSDSFLNYDQVGEVNLNVGDRVFLEGSYEDLRLFGGTGAFSFYTDIVSSQSDVFRPILREYQRILINSSSFNTVAFDRLEFSIEGSTTIHTATAAEFIADIDQVMIDALQTFGFSPSDYTLKETGTSGDTQYEILFAQEFVDIPNIDVEVIETNPSDNVVTEAIERSPFSKDSMGNIILDGMGEPVLNPGAVSVQSEFQKSHERGQHRGLRGSASGKFRFHGLHQCWWPGKLHWERWSRRHSGRRVHRAVRCV